ncbi:hypothetical protein C8J56DRAFT_1045666 [Mycena floridula]|nr:hypothetical protein C8J56DRAFT_1045666 [Mycena floridula]
MSFIADTMLISDVLGPCQVDTTSFAVFPRPPGVCMPVYYINQLDVGTSLVHVKKFYVLSKGPEPGIYSRWEDLESMGCISGQGFRWKGFEMPFSAITEWQKQCSAFHCHHFKALQPSPAPPMPRIPHSAATVASSGAFCIGPLVQSPSLSKNSCYSDKSPVAASGSAAATAHLLAPSGSAAINLPSPSTDQSLYSVTVEALVSPSPSLSKNSCYSIKSEAPVSPSSPSPAPSNPAHGSTRYFGLVSPSRKIIFSRPADAKDALAAADAHGEDAHLVFGEKIDDLACFFTDGGSLNDD